MSKSKVCSIEGCVGKGTIDSKGRRYLQRGWCQKHYQRFQKHGNPMGGNTYRGEPLKFFERSVLLETDKCVIWPFNIGNHGYGLVRKDSANRLVHRLALQTRVGEPPEGKPFALHKPVVCHTPACFNYRHLYWGSPLDNALDRVADGTRKLRVQNV